MKYDYRKDPLNYGDVVEVAHKGKIIRGAIVKLGVHPPCLDHVMISFFLWWFPAIKCRRITKKQEK